MKKLLFIALFLGFGAFQVTAQLLSGDLLESGRKLVSTSKFEIEGRYSGFQVFELSVDRDGIVTDAKLIPSKDGIISTPARIMASSALYKLEFEKATHYPKFHHVKVRMNFVKVTQP